MPLRKPGADNKVSKARVKSLEKLKRSTPAEKKNEIEYTVKTYFKYDESQRKQFYVISIFTVKEFASLNYEISVDVRKQKSVIDISLLGLNTRQTYYLEARSAYCDLLFENLFGKHTISLIKQDGSINQYIVDYNIFKKEITLLETVLPKKKNNRQFSTFTVVPELFTFTGD